MKIIIILLSVIAFFVIALFVFQSSCDLSSFSFSTMPSSNSQNETSTEKALSKNDDKGDGAKTQQVVQVPSDKDKTVNVSISVDTYLAFLNTIIKILTFFVAILGIGFALKYFGFSKEIDDWKALKDVTLTDMKKTMRRLKTRVNQIDRIKKEELDPTVAKIESQDKIIKPLGKIFQPGKQFDFLIRGNDTLAKQNYMKAEHLFWQSLLLEGESIEALVGLSQALRGLEKFDESLKTIDLALDMDKKDQRFDREGNISVLKMEMLEEMGKKDEASIIAKEVLKKNEYSKKAKKIIDSVKKPKKKK